MTGSPDGAAWTETALRAIRAAGHRSGGARQAVVELLAEHRTGLTALQIADLLHGRAGTASVYRALGLLVELGLLHALDLGQGATRYELILPDGQHHHHLVCRRCGRTDVFADPRLERVLARVEDDARYTIDGHDVVLRGLCPTCAGDNG